MSVNRTEDKNNLESAPDEIQEMLNRANDIPGVADVLRVYSNLDAAVATYHLYTMAQLSPPKSSSSATIA